ncbi:MAG: CotH kinase family protein [Clostridia bacterium]|nr:CotH kinase family protein [Clostridia bacterium]
MKRYLSIAICILFLFSLLSCTGEPGVPSEDPGQSVADSSAPNPETSSAGSEEDSGSEETQPFSETESGSPASEAAPAESKDDPGPGSSEPASEDENSPEPSETDSEPAGESSESTEPSEDSDPNTDESGTGSEDPTESSEDTLIPIRKNLIEGIRYTVSTDGYRSDSYGDFENDQGTACRYRLTDGAYADSGASGNICGYNDPTVTFYFDLGEEKTVEEWETDLWGGAWGIGGPEGCTVNLYWSVDGQRYIPADQATTDPSSIQTVGDFKKAFISRTLETPVKARYFRADYICSSFVWTSELKLFGTEMEEGGAIPRVNITTENNDRVHRSEYHTCTLEIIDPSKKFATILDPNGKIKIRGNSTSSGAKQPFNIKFAEKQDVLGMGACKKWYLLANMYDKTQIRNKLAYDFAADIGMAYVTQSTFVRVYLNGEYRGIYQLCESVGVGDSRVDINVNKNEFLLEYEPWEQYANENWIRTTNYNILLGFNDPETPTEAQRAYLKDFFRKAETAISSKKISEIEKYIDVDSFIDAYIVEEFFKEVDYQTSSTRFYIKGGKWYAGPVWDFDLSAGNCSSTYYTGYNNVGGSGNSWEGFWCRGLWNGALFKTPEIMQRLKERYLELQPRIVNLYQNNKYGRNRIDNLLRNLREEIDLNYTVWSTRTVYSDLERVPTDGTYDSEIEYLRKWLKNRNEWMLQALGLK